MPLSGILFCKTNLKGIGSNGSLAMRGDFNLVIGGSIMSEQNKARIVEFLDRVLSSGEISAAGEYFHADMVEEVPFPGQGPGLKGLVETLTALRVAFPDMRWHVQEQIAEDNRVLTRFIWEGTQLGVFLGLPPTNRAVSVWGMVIDKFEGSKIKSTRILMDTMGLMQQLGALPNGAQ